VVAQAEYQVLLERWALYKGDRVSLLMAKGQRDSQQAGIDIAKININRALIGADANNQFSRTILMFYGRPSEIRIVCQIPKGSLQFAPIAPLSSITTKASPTSISFELVQVLGCDEIALHVCAPPKPDVREEIAEEWPDDVLVGATWSVAFTDVKKDTKVEMPIVTEMGCLILALINSKDCATHRAAQL